MLKNFGLSNEEIGDVFESLECTGKIYHKTTKKGESYFVTTTDEQNNSLVELYNSNFENILKQLNRLNSDVLLLKQASNEKGFVVLIETLQEENKFLKKQLSDLTGLMGVLVPPYQRQSQCSVTAQTSLHNAENIKNTIAPNSSVNLSVNDTSLIDDNDKFIEKINLLDQQDGNNNSIINEIIDHQENSLNNINDQLIFVRNEFKEKYEASRKDSLKLKQQQPLKARLQGIAEYGKSDVKKCINSNKVVNNQISRHDISVLKISNSPVKRSNPSSKPSKRKSEVTVIVGDSIVRYVKGKKLSAALKDNFVVVKAFPGASTDCMKDYIKPTLKRKPNRIIVHTGTNDLINEETSPCYIANNIISLAQSIKTKDLNVTISGIIARGDKHNAKAAAVNQFLSHLCKEVDIDFISHNNIIPSQHLSDRLHPNTQGLRILYGNYTNYLEN